MLTSHVDTFTRDHLPASESQPQYLFELPELKFTEQLNCSDRLLDQWIVNGDGERVCLRAPGVEWTYSELQEKANRIANVLVRRMGLVAGNRVLLRAANKPMLVACWFAVMKVGGVAVATMPLLRAKELGQIIAKAEVSHALCDRALAEELDRAATEHPLLKRVCYFSDDSAEGLEALMDLESPRFDNVRTAAEDTCILAFTSGTTGLPKATMHFHRDVLAICECWPRHVLKLKADDIVVGSPPLGFTFGLGGLTLFPMHVGASSVLIEKAGPRELLDAVAMFGATVVFTAPTSYRAMAKDAGARRISSVHGGSLRKCVSAGEALSEANRALWKQHTGIELIDGIGATEMLHIFISADEERARAGATGVVVPGYRACVMDSQGRPAPPGMVGRLAVKGPTGCRYLADERQATYVIDGWNYTGDAYRMDEDGYFRYESRTDDMIVSAGYNIAATDVEEALMLHASVAECVVLGLPDPERGQIVKAFVVVRPGKEASMSLVKELQEFVKRSIAPYKYPRSIEFCESLPRTPSGKLQRFKLKERVTEIGAGQ